MFDRLLRQIQEKIRNYQYVMTLHAQEEMDDDELTIIDIEHVILNGRIVERQKELKSNEWKYLIQGKSLLDEKVMIVTKISITGRLIILTIYRE